MKKEIWDKCWYQIVFLYAWIVASSLLCFGTMFIRLEINWNYLYFYPIVGIVLFMFYSVSGFYFVLRFGRTKKDIENLVIR